jgi:stage II sporulation protein D
MNPESEDAMDTLSPSLPPAAPAASGLRRRLRSLRRLRLARETRRRVLAGLCLALVACGLGTALHTCLYAPARRPPVELPPLRTLSWPVTLAVRLATVRDRALITLDGDYTIEDLDNRLVETGIRLGPAPLTAGPGRPVLDGRPMPAAGFLIIPGRDGTLSLDGSAFRGRFKILPGAGPTLDVINLVDMEDYLRSVIAQEMSPSWPLDALKAQAVAARTYCVEHALRLADEPWQLNQYSMAYRGTVTESGKTNRAVDDTAGVVCLWAGRPFEAFYHSTCGGRTSSVHFVFDQREVPPLAGTDCGRCTVSPYYQWSFSADAAEVAASLADYGVTGIRSIRTGETDPAGRCRTVLINGQTRIPVGKFRSAVGVNRLRSACFTVRPFGDALEFSGRGWGHGVGLCQYGARELANEGRAWHEILTHYYPGSDLARIR